ncbi:MAG: CotH kinase family protein, partial [Calditrichales bacterium]|nr:CotH kinase family protein [Calditrichales bacterium]
MTISKTIMAALLLSAITVNTYSQELFINEIMSSNVSTLADKDGEYPDWLEIYNADTTTIDLANYGLSDNNSTPFEWTFPPVVIEPDSFLIVFASDKESQIPAVHYETVADWGDIWRYFIGTEEPPTNWRTLDFDASSWPEGPSGFGYSDGDDSTNVAPDYPSQPGPVSVFIRKEFYVEKPDEVSNCFLHIDYDDGFVAYLNNSEIVRANIGSVGTPPPYDQLTNTDHEAQMYLGGSPDEFEVENIQSILQSGWNVLAIQVHNASQTSSDMTLISFLTLVMNYIPQDAHGFPPFLNFLWKQELHASFKISSSGEELILTDPQGQTIDSIEFGAIPADISFGRQPDGNSQWYYFNDPTPGAANNTTGYQEFAPDVQFSHDGGFYDNQFPLELTAEGGSLTIRYTLDGSEPADTSNIYYNPIEIDSIMVVRARVFVDGMLPGKTITHTYFINQSFELPVVALSTDPANFFDNEIGIYVYGDDADTVNYPYFGSNFWEDWERPIHVEFFEKDGTQGFALDAGVKIFGSWSRLYPQKSLAVFARGRYGQDRINYPIFSDKNIQQYKAIILRNSGQDWGKTFFRDPLMSKLVINTDLDYMEYRPALVYLNGQCWGIHNIREKMNEHYLASNRGADPDNIDFLEWDKEKQDIIVIHGDGVQYRTLIDFINNNDLSDSDNYAYVQTLMDVYNFMDYCIAVMFYANPDWPWNNVKYWRPRTAEGKFKWLLFDNDYGFHGGHLWEGSNMFDEIRDSQSVITLLLFKLLENETFRNDFINRNADHLNITFDPARIIGLIQEMKTGIQAEMPLHIERWKNTFEGPWWLGKSIDTMNEWYNSIRLLNTYANGRGDYVRQHIKEEFNLNDGTGTIKIDVLPSNGGQIKMNSQVVKQYPCYGKYFIQVPVQLTALAKPGFRFFCWEGSDFPNSQTITFNIF